MADAYKGLTIQFGGDTTQLTKALAAAKSAAAETQSQLRLLNQALKFDSDSVEAVEQVFERLEDRAQALGARLSTTNEAISQLSSEVSKIDPTSTIGQLAEQTENAALNAKLADERYNTVNATLESLYRTANQQVKAAFESMVDEINEAARANEDFGETFNLLDSENLQETIERLEKAGVITPEVAKDFATLNANLDLHDSSNLETTIDELEQAGVELGSIGSQLVVVHNNWAEAFADKETADKILKLQQMQTETTQLTAEIQSLAEELAKAEFKTDLSEQLEAATKKAESFDDELAEATKKADALDEAMELNPDSIETAEARVDALETATEAAKKKAAALKEAIEAYNSKSINGATDETKELASRTEEVTQEWALTKAELMTAEGYLEQLQSAMKTLKLTVGESSDAYKEVAEQVAECEKRVEELRAAEKEAAEARAAAVDAADAVALAEQYDEAQAAVSEYEQRLTEAKEAAKAAETAAESMGDAAEEAGDEAESGAAKATVAWGEVGYALDDLGDAFSGLSNAAQNAISSMIDSADTIDSAYRDMAKTVNATDDELEELYESAIETSSTSIVSADQILEIEALGGQLGIAVEDLEEFATVASNISIASDLEADEAAEQLGELANILDDLTVDSMANFSDALVRLGNNTAASESEILDISTRIGSMGSIVGMSADEILAWSATIAATGQNAEAAGTAIANTMSDIETAVASGVEEMAEMTSSELAELEESGGNSLMQFAEVAGMSAEEFAEAWEEDPSYALQSFIEGLNELEEDGGSATTVLSELGITSTRQVQAIEGLMQTVDGLNDNLTMSADAWNGVSDEWGDAGDAANEAAKKSEGFSASLDKIENAIENIGAALGEALTPYLETAADMVSELAEWFTGLSDSMKLTVTAVTGIVAVLSPALTAIGKVMSGVSKLSSVTTVATTATATATTAVTTATTATTAAATAAGTATTAVGGLSAGFVAVAAAAAVVAGVALFNWLSEVNEETERVNSASRTYSDLLAEVKANSEGAAESIDLLGISYEDVIEDIDDTIESIGEFNDTIVDTLTEVETSTAALDYYADVIEEYAGKTDLSAYEQGLLEAALDGVNEKLGTNYELTEDNTVAIDGEEQSVRELIDALEDSIDSYKRQAEAAAYTSLLEEGYEELTAAQLELNEATVAYEAYLNDTEAYDTWLASMERTYGSIETYEEYLADAGLTLDEAWERNVQSFTDVGQAYEELTEEVANLQENVDGLATSAAIASSTLSDDMVEALLALPSAAQESGYNIATSLQAGIDAGSITAEQAAQYLSNNVASAFETLPESAYESGGAVIASISEAFASGEVTLAEATAALDALVTDGLSTLPEDAQETGGEIAELLAQGLLDGSIYASDASEYLTETMTTTFADCDTEVAEIGYGLAVSLADNLASGELSVEIASEALRMAAKGDDADWQTIYNFMNQYGINLTDELSSAISTGAIEVNEETATMLADIMLQLTDGDLEAAAEALGVSIPQGIAAGTTDYGDEAVDASEELAKAIIEQAETTLDTNSPSKEFEQLGIYIDEGLETGINGSTDGPLSAISSLASSLISELTGADLPTQASNEGAATTSGYASGISSKKSEVTGAADDVADAAYTMTDAGDTYTPGSELTTQFKKGIYSAYSTVVSVASDIATAASKLVWNGDTYASGQHLGSQFAAGIKSMVSTVKAAAQKIANIAASLLQFSVPEDGPWSGAEKGGFTSGQHLAENFAEGLRSGVESVQSAAAAIASAVDLQSMVDDVQAETAAAVQAAAADVSTNVEVSQTSRADRADDIIAALKGINGGYSITVNIDGTTVGVTSSRVVELITALFDEVDLTTSMGVA